MNNGFAWLHARTFSLLSGAMILVFIAATGATYAASASVPTARNGATALSQPDQIAAGSEVFQQVCSKCHGDDGQGGDAPPLIGAGNSVSDYRNARRLFDFLSSSMPDDAPGSLSAKQYYDVIAFILNRNGWKSAGQAIDASTAEGIALSR